MWMIGLNKEVKIELFLLEKPFPKGSYIIVNNYFAFFNIYKLKIQEFDFSHIVKYVEYFVSGGQNNDTFIVPNQHCASLFSL